MGSLGPKPLLLAFDFDHTVVDGNTDTHVIKASPSGRLPDDLKASYQPGRWTEYMQRVFDHLHEEGVSVADMQRVMQQLPYTQGMEALLQEVQQSGSIAGHPCSCIILSDSNTEFIEWILSSRGHRGVFSHVYTNPGSVSAEGRLHVTAYHSHQCTCPVNMCKRLILQQHQQGLSGQGVQPRVAYVGDGSNDMCPAQSLGPDDVVFARAGYALEKLLQDPAVKATVAARVHVWSSASEIAEVLGSL